MVFNSSLLAGTILALLGKIVWDWLKERKGNGNGNGSAVIDHNLKKAIYDVLSNTQKNSEELKETNAKLDKLIEQGVRTNTLLEQIANKH